MQTFYGLKEGHSEKVTIKFEANPSPTEGFWKLAGVETPIQVGTESIDKNFKASHVKQTQVCAAYSSEPVIMIMNETIDLSY